ncbi:MAG: hypothetical protein HQ521_06230, partial [Bacteroidetes bacterium]|nr:hypothetical protein [Bacteroidota bacterium]
MIRKLIFYFLLIVLFLPIVELNIDLVNEKELKGFYVKKEDVNISFSDWFSGDYQTNKEAFIKDTIGFNKTLTRIGNQLDYALFNVNHTHDVVIGNNDVLYQKMYIDAYYGRDYVGHNTLSNQVQKYVLLQNQLNEQGIDLFLIITPGKASFFPENIPDNLKSKKDTTNYNKTIQLLKEKGGKFLDLKSYLLSLNKGSKYPLFPNHGTHWSGYAVTLAADTLFSFLESNTNFDFLEYHTDEGYITEDYRFSDNDIGLALNLLFKNTHQQLYYPEVNFAKSDTSRTIPNVLLIGDSFTQSFWRFYPYFPKLFADKSRFWYYNEYVAWPPEFNGRKVGKLDLHEEINSRDIILILTTEQNLSNFGFGFIEKAYAILTDNNVLNKEKLNYYINSIKSSPQYLMQIEQKALSRNIPIDSMLFLDARWLYNNYLIEYFSKKI